MTRMMLVNEIVSEFDKYKCPYCDRDLNVTNEGQLIMQFDIHPDDNEECRQFISGLNMLYTPFYLNNAEFPPIREYLDNYAVKKGAQN